MTDAGAQSLSRMRALLDAHGLSPRRALGQHFLADPNITRKVVYTAEVGPQSKVVEIGVGTGTLTAALAETGATVVGYEIDTRLRPLLEEVLGRYPNVEMRFADAGRIELAAALEGEGWVMVANLPYNVGTSIVLDALRHAPGVERIVVMVQLEVAQRFVATVGTPAYGLPSVVVGLHADARLAFRVPPHVFVPPPRVDSAVVRIDRRAAPPGAERAIRLASAGFGQRRKMLRRSLDGVIGNAEAYLTEARIDPTARAEELAPGDWLRLAEVVDG